MTIRPLLLVALAAVVSLPNLLFAQDGDRRRRDRDRGGERGEGQRGEGQRGEGQRGPGGIRGPGGPGGPGGMMGMMGGMMGMMGGGGANQLLGLLRMDEVREEVGVSDEVYEAIQSSQRESWGQMRDLRGASEERRTEIMEEMNSSAQELLDEVLPPAKQKRLMGLMIQQVGAPAVLNQMVAKEIGLSESSSEEIRKELESFGSRLREQFAGMREGGGFPDFSRIQEEMTKVREELNQTIESKLTEEQKKSLEELKGEKFDFPEGGMFGRGFGGGQGFGGPGARGGDRGGDRGRGGPGRPRRGSDRD